MMHIKRIDWPTLLYVWKHDLWPGRYEYKNMSSMVYNQRDEYDMDIYEKYAPAFWGVYDGTKLVGVNSGFRTTDTLYRSRGIFVDLSYRKRGIATMLFDALQKQAIGEGCTQMWSYPREGSQHAYLKFGFEMTGKWQSDTFGRNAYVLKDI